MYEKLNQVHARLRQRDARGGYLLAVTGDESVEELREVAQNVMLICPAARTAAGCPFDQLATLTDQSMQAALAHLNREDLLALFEMERQCRSRALNAAG